MNRSVFYSSKMRTVAQGHLPTKPTYLIAMTRPRFSVFVVFSSTCQSVVLTKLLTTAVF